MNVMRAARRSGCRRTRGGRFMKAPEWTCIAAAVPRRETSIIVAHRMRGKRRTLGQRAARSPAFARNVVKRVARRYHSRPEFPCALNREKTIETREVREPCHWIVA